MSQPRRKPTCKCRHDLPIPSKYFKVKDVTIRASRSYYNTMDSDNVQHNGGCASVDMLCSWYRFSKLIDRGVLEEMNPEIPSDCILVPTTIEKRSNNRYKITGALYATMKTEQNDLFANILFNHLDFPRFTLSSGVSAFMDIGDVKSGILARQVEVNTDEALATRPMPVLTGKTLKPHQEINIKFMRNAETEYPLWSRVESGDPDLPFWICRYVHNNVLGQVPNRVLHGGFICDDMGMGKTITAIALVVDDPGMPGRIVEVERARIGPLPHGLVEVVDEADEEEDETDEVETVLEEEDEAVEIIPVDVEPTPAPAPAPAPVNACPTCTFHNTLTALVCNICDGPLDPPAGTAVPAPVVTAPAPASTSAPRENNLVRDRFMNELRLSRRRYKMVSGGTLYCAQPKLIMQVAKQFRETAPGLRVGIYASGKRPTSMEELVHFDVVIASYNILASDYTKANPSILPERSPVCTEAYRSTEVDASRYKSVEELVDNFVVHEGQIWHVDFATATQATLRRGNDSINVSSFIQMPRAKRDMTRICGGSFVDNHCVTCGAIQGNLAGPGNRGPIHSTSIFDIYWHRIIYDESQVMKSSSTKTAQAAAALNTRSAWALTGTPWEKSYNDISSQMFAMGLCSTSRDKNSSVAAFSRLVMAHEKTDDLISTNVNIHDLPVDVDPADRARLRRAALATKIEYSLYKMNRINTMAVTRRMRRVLHAASLASTAKLLAMDEEFDQTEFDSMMARRAAEAEARAAMRTAIAGTDLMNPSKDDTVLSSDLTPQIGPEDECPICMVEFERPLGLCCSKTATHVFCYECIKQVWQRRTKCPTCRGTPRKSVWVRVVDPAMSPPSSKTRSATQAEPTSAAGDVMAAPESPSLAGDVMAPPARRARPAMETPKTRAVVAKAREIISTDPSNRVIIFTQFKPTVKIMYDALTEAGIGARRITGDISFKRRFQAIEDLSGNSVQVLVTSLASASTGLDMFAANNIIFADLTPNKALEAQAIGRAHRIGQTRDVEVYRFYSKDTIEEDILLDMDPVADLKLLNHYRVDELRDQLASLMARA